MREKFKKEIDSMETCGIISKFDGRDISPEWLNKEIVRPVCNSQTMDDAIEKLKGANTLLSLIQVRASFMYLWTRNQKCHANSIWHICL